MPKQKSVNIDSVLLVLMEVKGSQKKAAEKLQTSQASVSRCLKEHGYVPHVTYVRKEHAS